MGEVIDLSHWLGALIASREIIGGRGTTPVRRLIDRVASLIPNPKLCLAMVVAPGGDGLTGLYGGTPEEAWAGAADHSARVHITYVERPFRRVLSVIPEIYEDIWTAAKGMYKLEPAVADGGEARVGLGTGEALDAGRGEVLKPVAPQGGRDVAAHLRAVVGEGAPWTVSSPGT